MECCNTLNLKRFKLTAPIIIKSIHGEELATEIAIHDIKIISGTEEADLTQVEMIVLQNRSADIIVGMLTMREHRVFSKLT